MDVPEEVGVSDLYTFWDFMFENWEHGYSSLDNFFCWIGFSNYIGEETSKFIYVYLLPAVSIGAL